MNETFQILAALLAAIWFGGIVTATPILVLSSQNITGVQPLTVSDVVRALLRDIERVQLPYGVLLIIVGVLGGAPLILFLLIIFMLILVAATVFYLHPRRETLLDLATDGIFQDGSPEKSAYQQVVIGTYATQGFKMLMGGMLVAVITMA